MTTLNNLDCFVYGVLTAISSNSGKPFKVSMKEMQTITNMNRLQITSSIKILAASQKLNAIFFGDEICVHVAYVLPVMITGEAA